MPNFTEIDNRLNELEFELNDAQMLIDEARRLPFMQTPEFETQLDVAQLRLNAQRDEITQARNTAEYLKK